MKIYTVENFNDILFNGHSYVLPENVRDTINNLIKEVEAFAPATTSSVSEEKQRRPSQGSGFNKKPKMRKNDSFEDWNTQRSFKPTIIEIKEGAEKIITDIRVCLNKISAKNYDNQKEQIINLIPLLIKENNEDLSKIGNSIFESASNNKFNSNIYANLYKDILVHFPNLKETFIEFLDNYIENTKEIHYVDSNVDYDKYCEYNKKNDKRKAISTFLSNLVINGVLETKKVFEIISYLQNTITEYMEMENRSNEIEEITENMYLFITLLHESCKQYQEWQVIVDTVDRFSKLKVKEKKSLSSRAIFKYMDILEAIEKQ
jgi:hypothetical protein